MGTNPDVEIANLLADREEKQARLAANPPAFSWRWSRTGWGDWNTRKNSTSASMNTTAPREGATRGPAGRNTKD
jgi:hypothetical protein